MTINNQKDLKDTFSKVLQQGLIQTSEKIKSIIDSYLDSWYHNYLPVQYKRTKTFLNNANQGVHGVGSPQVGNSYIRFWSNTIDEINHNQKAVILAGFIEYAKSQRIPINLK